MNGDAFGAQTQNMEGAPHEGHKRRAPYGKTGPEIILVLGLVKLVPAVAYHFCLNLPATFLQPRTSNISGPTIGSQTDSFSNVPIERLGAEAMGKSFCIGAG